MFWKTTDGRGARQCSIVSMFTTEGHHVQTGFAKYLSLKEYNSKTCDLLLHLICNMLSVTSKQLGKPVPNIYLALHGDDVGAHYSAITTNPWCNLPARKRPGLHPDLPTPAHYSDLIMRAMASQITGVSIVYSIVCSGADRRKNQSSASLAFLRGNHRRPVNSPHKGPVTRKTFLFDDVIMANGQK